jgi:hypothetical protein
MDAKDLRRELVVCLHLILGLHTGLFSPTERRIYVGELLRRLG